MNHQPVYRRPRSHAYSCRCPRCAQAPRNSSGSAGDFGPAIILFFIGVVIGFWPAMVWHGYTDTGGWRWDIHSTVAEAVYWGILLFTFALIGHSARPLKAPRPRPVVMPPSVTEALEAARLLEQEPPAPVCLHLHAERVESVLDRTRTLAFWCPQCETQLDEDFGRTRRPCCGTAPGGPHQWDCPEGVTP